MNAVVQKSQDWHKLREGRITGSRIGAILGNNPHSKREDVMREMVRDALGLEREFQGNEATRHGEKHEPYARAWYEANHKVSVDETGFIVHPDYSFVGVSPDGLVGFDGAIEIKCPFYTRVPYSVYDKPHYLDQCRLVMEVGRLAWIDFVCWINDDTVHVDRVHHDPLWFPTILPKLTDFMEEYIEILDDPAKQKPFTKPKTKSEYRKVEDGRLDRLSVLHKQIALLEGELKPLKEEFDKLKVDIYERYGYCHNEKIKVGCVERKGAVDWKALSKDLSIPDATQDKFRKASTYVYSVEEFK